VEGEYQRFIDQTGIQFERDLDEVAMSRRDTPDGRDTESAEVFVGRFDEQRLRTFLESISAQRDSYQGHIIYVIPHEGHTVRVCLLGSRRVAVTNMASSDAMHEIIDAAENSPAGPSLLQAYYQHVPTATLAWLLVRTGSGSQTAQLPSGWSFDFLENTVTVGSVRYEGDLLLRADVIAASDNEARRVVDSATSFLSMYRTIAQSVGAHGNDPDVKAAIDSIHVAQDKNVAVFTATLSQRFLKKVITEAGSQAAAPAASPSPTPERKHRRQRQHKPTARPTPPAA
jgi:ribosomal protein L12E/L44/L45/RPP1/RPP2